MKNNEKIPKLMSDMYQYRGIKSLIKFIFIIFNMHILLCLGAFVFPFILMLLMLGIPLMFMELSIGQFTATGPAILFDRLCPLFHGMIYNFLKGYNL